MVRPMFSRYKYVQWPSPKEDELQEYFYNAQPKQCEGGYKVVQQEDKASPTTADCESWSTRRERHRLVILRGRRGKNRDAKSVCNGAVCERRIGMSDLFGMEYQAAF